jgi:hypothetical protein
MDKPSTKDIRAAIEKLKAKPEGHSKPNEVSIAAKLEPQKNSKRIRKQGV